MAYDKKTVLIAEDENDLREMYVMALSDQGFEVLPAANGKEALKWLDKKAEQVSLILLDIVMPEMGGFETLAEIKKNERFQKVPVVFLTNLDNDGDRQQASEMGAVSFFVKAQHTPAELVTKIKPFISESAV